MKILALDTSTKSISTAVSDDLILLSEITVINEKTHSVKAMDLIQKVLALSGLEIKDLDGFAVCLGPGTFTGLRIGISVIQGMGAATGKPIIGVSSLETLARQVSGPGVNLICPLVDARRGEVYGSLYRNRAGALDPLTHEQVAKPLRILRRVSEPVLITGSGAELYRHEITEKMGKLAFFASGNRNIIHASTIAFLGLSRFKQKKFDDSHVLVPRYIRKSDAELKLGNKTK